MTRRFGPWPGRAVRRGGVAGAVVAGALALAACGPLTVDQAERQCLERARLAQQPRGEVAVGIGSDGKARGALELTVTSDFLTGRDPAAVFETCVMQRSGQPPSRSVFQMPGWTG